MDRRLLNSKTVLNRLIILDQTGTFLDEKAFSPFDFITLLFFWEST